jgi:class 3 adenylate cyclase
VKTVMITDMKSFSKMTEEDGSMLTAKAIQKHRDLLLPLIERNHGHGKSTGGDGLVAAFEDEGSALQAAVEMQQALAQHNAAHPDSREMTVRIGVAKGDIVLDKGGRPFIGNALNTAARIMNLADGGQAFTSAAVFSKAGPGIRGHSHGEFELKNIAKPVEIVELLWAEGQKPEDPRERIAST